MELRDILIIVTLLVIAVILIDGIRRMRKKKSAAIAPVLSRMPSQVEEAIFNPELPGGGARVLRREPRIAPDIIPPTPVSSPSRVEQVDMFGGIEMPAGEPAAAREIRERGELPRRMEKPAKPKPPAPEEVIVVHVLGGDARLNGRTLLQSVLACGMRFGEYNIFHRYESAAHDALAMFSMASAVEPGVFDLDAMEEQSFVGVSFFLMLPGPANSRQALDLMIEAARRVAAEGNGELHDQQHSVLTAQTVEHLRQRVMEYERRRLAQQLANN